MTDVADTPAARPQRPAAAFFASARSVFAQDDAAHGGRTRVEAHRAAVAAFNDAGAAVSSVVVVGEIGRGKSTLVNALLGRPEASPTGPGETTGTYLAFQPADDDLPAGQAELEATDGSRRRVPVAELESWVRIEDAELREARALVPLGARVAVDDMPFGTAWIIDTPGVGGLEPNHARIALARAADAAVLLLVTDAHGVLTTGALRFLEQSAERVAAVVVVVTKIDQVPDWQKVVDDDRRALTTSSDWRIREAPVVAVSALTRLRAVGAPPERATGRIERSRLPQLQALLTERLASGDRLGRARAIRSVQVQLDDVARVAELDLAAVRDERVAAEAEADQARLAELKAQNATWRLVLEQRIGLARQDVVVTTGDRLRDFGDRWQRRVDALRWGLSAAAMERVHAEMTADLFAVIEDVRSFSTRTMRDAVASTLTEIGLSGVVVPQLEPSSPAADLVPVPVRGETDGIDVGVLMTGFSGFRLAGMLAGTTTGGGVAAMIGLTGAAFPVSIGLGVAGAAGMIALNLLTRGAQMRKRNLETNVAKNVQELRAAMTLEFDRLVLMVRPGLVGAVETAVRQESERVAQRVAAARAAQREGEQARHDRIDELRARLSAARAASTAGDRIVRLLLG